MANRPMILQQNLSSKLIWVDPTRLSTSFSVSRKLTQIKGKVPSNHVSNLFVTARVRALPRPEGCEDKCAVMPNENQSIRTTIAGTAENVASLKAEWEAHKANIDALFINGDAGLGFLNKDAAIVTSDIVA